MQTKVLAKNRLSQRMRSKRFKAVLHRTWMFVDGSKDINSSVEIPAGEYTLVVVPNPFGYKAPWLVIEGTLNGAAMGYWFSWPMKTHGKSGFGIEVTEIV